MASLIYVKIKSAMCIRGHSASWHPGPWQQTFCRMLAADLDCASGSSSFASTSPASSGSCTGKNATSDTDTGVVH